METFLEGLGVYFLEAPGDFGSMRTVMTMIKLLNKSPRTANGVYSILKQNTTYQGLGPLTLTLHGSTCREGPFRLGGFGA